MNSTIEVNKAKYELLLKKVEIYHQIVAKADEIYEGFEDDEDYEADLTTLGEYVADVLGYL